MSYIRSKIPLIAIIILSLIILFFTARDLFYEKQLFQLYKYILARQMLQRILMLYLILIIFIIVLIYSYTTKKSSIMSLYGEIFEESPEGNLRYYKCPNCNEIFTIKKTKASKYHTLVSCPYCKITGRLTSNLKSGYKT